MKEQPTWRLTLRPLADQRDADGTRRVRAVLKMLLRSFRLQCTHVAKVEPESVRQEHDSAGQAEGGGK